jgi:hypothetical protein
MGRDAELPIGHAWLEILRRPSQEAFASAFTRDVVLDASVANASIVGVVRIRAFFDATRAMYDQIAFVHETHSATRTYLEWEGSFGGREVSGTTILARDATGLIQSIRLYHRPYAQVLAFSAELARLLADRLDPGTSPDSG